jgi:hypothetical protein
MPVTFHPRSAKRLPETVLWWITFGALASLSGAAAACHSTESGNEIAPSATARAQSALTGSANVIWALLAILLAIVAGCGGRHGPPRPEVVEECEQYETAVKSCFHRDIAIASRDVLLPATPAERERIRGMCRENLERIQRACR